MRPSQSPKTLKACGHLSCHYLIDDALPAKSSVRSTISSSTFASALNRFSFWKLFCIDLLPFIYKDCFNVTHKPLARPGRAPPNRNVAKQHIMAQGKTSESEPARLSFSMGHLTTTIQLERGPKIFLLTSDLSKPRLSHDGFRNDKRRFPVPQYRQFAHLLQDNEILSMTTGNPNCRISRSNDAGQG